MYDRVKSMLFSFDEIFNDNFVDAASEDEIESRFEYFRNVCDCGGVAYDELLEELEFSCNSYIDEVARLCRYRRGALSSL